VDRAPAGHRVDALHLLGRQAVPEPQPKLDTVPSRPLPALVSEVDLDPIERPALAPRVQRGRDRRSAPEGSQEQLDRRRAGIVAADGAGLVGREPVRADPDLVAEACPGLDVNWTGYRWTSPGLVIVTSDFAWYHAPL